MIWNKIKSECLSLIQDRYGNYFIQLIIELRMSSQINDSIVKIVVDNLSLLSFQKASSNVVERCIEISNREQRSLIFSQMFHPNNVISYLTNEYTKFVIKTAVKNASEEDSNFIISGLNKEMDAFSPSDQKKVMKLIKKLTVKKE